MELLAALGGGAFVLVSAWLGVRLLMLAARTREIPELACGLGLLLMGGIGYPLLAVSQQATGLSIPVRTLLVAVQMLCHVVGNTAFCIFVYRVFRPGVRWARALTTTTCAAVTLTILAQVAWPGIATFVESGAGAWRWHGAIAIGPLSWAGLESIAYHRRLRKRLALGLADPLITDRFRLWAIGMFCAVTITVTSVVLEILGTPMVSSAFGGLVAGVMGCAASVAMWLAFLPPRAYLRHVASRTVAAG